MTPWLVLLCCIGSDGLLRKGGSFLRKMPRGSRRNFDITRNRRPRYLLSWTVKSLAITPCRLRQDLQFGRLAMSDVKTPPKMPRGPKGYLGKGTRKGLQIRVDQTLAKAMRKVIAAKIKVS